MVVDNLKFPMVFSNFSKDFQQSLATSDLAAKLLRTITFFSTFCAFFTLFVVCKSGAKIHKEYRNILKSQLWLTGIGSIIVTFISPFIIYPYPAIFTTGPIIFNYQVTLVLCFSIILFYFFPTMVLLSFGLIYNYFSLKQMHTQIFNLSIDRFMKCMIVSVTLLIFLINFILLVSVAANDQHSLQHKVAETLNISIVPLFEENAIFIFDAYCWQAISAAVEGLLLVVGSMIFCIIITILSWKEFETQKTFISQPVARNHRMMLYMLFTYVLHFIIFFTLPILIAVSSVYTKKPIFGLYTFPIVISPAHFLGITLSITYCLIMKPYRIAIVSLIYKVSRSRSENECYVVNYPSTHLPAVDGLTRQQSARIGSLF